MITLSLKISSSLKNQTIYVNTKSGGLLHDLKMHLENLWAKCQMQNDKDLIFNVTRIQYKSESAFLETIENIIIWMQIIQIWLAH